MTIYLYVKTHRKTGLKYLGKTGQDPYKYRGSGTVWKRHLKVHGNEVDTEILKECHTHEEIKYWGIHYSKLWNVTDSNSWANIIPESGEGGGQRDLKLYNFVHDNGLSVYCTRSELCDIYDLPANKITELVKNIRKSVYGWRMLDRTGVGYSKHRRDPKIYHFIHDNGTEEQCQQWDLYTKYTLPQQEVSKITRGAYRLGWKLKIDQQFIVAL